MEVPADDQVPEALVKARAECEEKFGKPAAIVIIALTQTAHMLENATCKSENCTCTEEMVLKRAFTSLNLLAHNMDGMARALLPILIPTGEPKDALFERVSVECKRMYEALLAANETAPPGTPIQ